MEVSTTSIQELTERLARQSERQAALLVALRAFKAAAILEQDQPAPARAFDTDAVPDRRPTFPGVDGGVDSLAGLWQLPRSGESPSSTVGSTPASVGFGAADADFDAAPASDPALLIDVAASADVELDPEPAPVEASTYVQSVEATGTASLGADHRRVERNVQPRPAPGTKVHSRSSSPASRRRRDYNYFADLEARLSTLTNEARLSMLMGEEGEPQR